jgi:hypothetical protein
MMSDVVLNKVKEFCFNAIEDANEAIENADLTDGSEDIFEGRLEFANSLLDRIQVWEDEWEQELKARAKLNLN